jgi:hypothetical protein
VNAWYHRSVLVFSVLFVGIGVALLAITAARGGGSLGFVLGGLFIALGVARFTVERKRSWRGR